MKTEYSPPPTQFAGGIKNTTFVEVNVMNISVKFQLYSPIASEELIFEYFSQYQNFGNQITNWTTMAHLERSTQETFL